MQTEQAQRERIESTDLREVAKAFGTPVYVYDAEKILAQYRSVTSAFQGLDLKVKYAAKALTNLSILRLLRDAGAGLDVVSIEEAWLGMQAGFDPSEILFTPNCVSFDEIRQGVDMGLVINIDNISVLEQFGHAYGGDRECCIRLNPHIVGGGNSKIQTGHIDSKFGISVLQMRHVHRVIKTYGINVVGLHVHTGSDILNPEVFLRGAEIVFDAAHDFADLRFIDFGSGFKVAYKEGDITTDLQTLGQELKTAFQSFCKEYGRELEIWFEPGKYLVSEAGTLLVTVNVIKQTPATVFVGVNSGMNHLLRPMLYDAHHEIDNITNPDGIKRVYSVVGYICETDTFGYDRKLSEVREGDVLAIRNAGAYGYSMCSNYNSRLKPAEVLLQNGAAHLIRRRQVLESLLEGQLSAPVTNEFSLKE